jgi:hypothetical protein
MRRKQRYRQQRREPLNPGQRRQLRCRWGLILQSTLGCWSFVSNLSPDVWSSKTYVEFLAYVTYEEEGDAVGVTVYTLVITVGMQVVM